MINAIIKHDTDNSPGLWLFIENDESPEDDVAYPIDKEEIRPIMEACQDYLGERDVPLPVEYGMSIPGFEHVEEDLKKLTIRKKL